MCIESRHRAWRAVALVLAMLGCAPDSALESGLEPPGTVRATALGTNSIQVTWTTPPSVDVFNYLLQRRANLEGKFETIVTIRAESGTSYLDSGLSPGTFYGYRLITVDRLGDQSGPSTVAGALTAPMPGIQVITGQASLSADPDGYRLAITGPEDTSTQISVSETRLFAPLLAGSYTVTLSDVLPTCQVVGDSSRTVVVNDQGLNTVQRVQFNVSCLDPTRGRITAILAVTGDSLDADGYRVDFAGIVPGDPVPALGGANVAPEGGSPNFENLQPGDYELTLSDVDAPCSIAGLPSRTVTIAALSSDTVRFAVSCPDKGAGSGPFIWRNTWTPQSAPNGQNVSLDVTVDLTAIPTQDFGLAQAIVTYNPAVLQYVSATAPAGNALNNLTVNASTPGTITFGNYTTGTAPQGMIGVARFTFQVKSPTGSSVTRTQVQTAAAGDGFTPLTNLFRVIEDTFTVGGGGANQPPTAHVNGPYSGTVSGAVNFSSAGSSDPDGSISGYSWAFGDGATSTQANPAHGYGTAGNYTATLTVTDNLGLTGSAQTAVTINGSGGNLPPTAVAGGPYNGVAGVAMSFSSVGSSDPDGSITGYRWDFGDGGASSQANPTHGYAAAGNYTATLTVTDNLGAIGTAPAAVTVTAASGLPFSWTSAFGAFEPVLGTYPMLIALNLGADIPETPGSEALGSFVVDSLVWNPAVLQYHSLTFGSGGGSFNTTNAIGGCKCKLLFNGSPTSNTGVVTIATVRFVPVGAPGTSTTLRTSLGPVLSTAALGGFNYRAKIQIVDATLTLP